MIAYYLGIAWRTVKLSLLITSICAAVAFPLASIMARARPRLRAACAGARGVRAEPDLITSSRDEHPTR